MAIQISCTDKDDRYSPFEAITAIGGKNPDGSSWKLTQKEAIRDIENGKYSFYVSKNGHSVKVIVSVSPYGNKYIKTESDGQTPDNLLSLDKCPL